jgi:glycosyltransferase involved in cell wall biosynthesis
LIATVLPPREGFSPHAVGAIGLLVHRLAQPGDVIVGQACDAPFPDRRFVSVPKTLWPPFDRASRYAAGVMRVLHDLRPDLVEIHNRPNLALALAHALPNTQLTLFLHNDPLAMRKAGEPAERASIARRMAVICPSAYLANRFMENVAAGTPRPAMLPNTLDLAALPPRLPLEAREQTVLFAGRVVADKGADAFVRAWAAIRHHLPGWRAVMIGADRFFPGSPDTDFIRALRPMADQAGIGMRGYLPHAAILSTMARAAIVAVPSRWPEPFGLAALEALASGAALVCGPAGGLPELAGEAALYAHPDSPGALEQALLTLAENPAQRIALAKAGLARAAAYDSADGVRRLAALRRDLLRARMA